MGAQGICENIQNLLLVLLVVSIEANMWYQAKGALQLNALYVRTSWGITIQKLKGLARETFKD